MANGAYPSIHEALGALEDYLEAQSFSQDPDPHVARIVLRSGEQYQGKVRHADIDSITLIELPPHGATKRVLATDISYLAVALPAPRRWLTVAIATLVLGDVIVGLTRLFRAWLNDESLIVLIVLVGMTGLAVWYRYDKPGSNLLPWVVTFSDGHGPAQPSGPSATDDATLSRSRGASGKTAGGNAM